MKSNLLHICFVLDESGSMYSSVNDVIGGFQKLIDEQKQIKDGECIVSVYRFANEVKSDFIGKPVAEVKPLEYNPTGCTAMNDGIGTAIDEIGLWLSDMDESERPSKNLIVIMTDGEENASKEYTLKDVKDRIQHQEEKYNWSFVYMGSDVRSLDDAKALGIRISSLSSKAKVQDNYLHISNYATNYRVLSSDHKELMALDALSEALHKDTVEYSASNKTEVR